MSGEFTIGCLMRLWVRARRVGLSLILVWLGTLLWTGLSYAAVADEANRLEVQTDPGGGVRATARVVFPAKPDVILRILTDYLKWPELFDTKMRVANLSIDRGIATTDLRISHLLLPGEQRLVSESRTLADGGLVTDLKGGDFKRYHRVWKLAPMDNGSRTIAEFELIVEIETMLPDWLVAFATRRELETHFRIVREKALQKSRMGN